MPIDVADPAALGTTPISREDSFLPWPLECDSVAGSLASARSLDLFCLPDDAGRYMLAAAVMAKQAVAISMTHAARRRSPRPGGTGR